MDNSICCICHKCLIMCCKMFCQSVIMKDLNASKCQNQESQGFLSFTLQELSFSFLLASQFDGLFICSLQDVFFFYIYIDLWRWAAASPPLFLLGVTTADLLFPSHAVHCVFILLYHPPACPPSALKPSLWLSSFPLFLLVLLVQWLFIFFILFNICTDRGWGRNS